ncbi:cytochrome c oxidase biogenesis protein Cmc1-like protein [Massariosphaeria phaeospora]|uniref:COX assembly mitochondrial protein n=1 Tax=Massariosphaeria phaeospora TaxID=100035 RepID=A0A7C8M5U7_9PLEO|nr:cytochrome c oxidase biogenesis protein Cmc1-like protein [Massariosphaeria phaeospora]
MHPHLHTVENQKNCAEVIAALDECHARGFIHKVLGNCTDAKQKVNMCLRAQRLERTKLNREMAKAKRAKIEKAWAEIDENR